MGNQNFLDKIYSKDDCLFLSDVDNWCNHRPLLYLALEISEEGTILELGVGKGSTPNLVCYALKNKRRHIAFDTNHEWLNTYQHAFTSPFTEWEYRPDNEETDKYLQEITQERISVCLVDHACGERRHSDILAIKDKVDIFVIHDAETAATGYMLYKIWGEFKYRLNYNSEGACAAIVSNMYNVEEFDGLRLGEFSLEKRVV